MSNKGKEELKVKIKNNAELKGCKECFRSLYNL
jgi:hypothetical protein